MGHSRELLAEPFSVPASWPYLPPLGARSLLLWGWDLLRLALSNVNQLIGQLASLSVWNVLFFFFVFVFCRRASANT